MAQLQVSGFVVECPVLKDGEMSNMIYKSDIVKSAILGTTCSLMVHAYAVSCRETNSVMQTCFDAPITYEYVSDNNRAIILGDSLKVMESMTSESVDLIFADPPYALEELPTLPSLIFGDADDAGADSGRTFPLLKEGGLFVLEHGDQYDFSGHPHFLDLRTYGSVHFSFFQ